MSRAVVWVHADNLNPGQTALQENQDCPAVFVWDERLLRRRELSLKRILFIYEGLLDLPVSIRRGRVIDELSTFAEGYGVNEVITMRSISPGFERIAQGLRERGLRVTVHDEEPFVTLPDEPDLRRFSRYWRVAQPQLSSANADQ